MISIFEALDNVRQHVPLLSVETVALDLACGSVLAEDVFADMDLPPFHRSQMDGFALKTEDTQNVPVRLKIVGESAAGSGWHQILKAGEAVRIMTGAPVPEGANAVQKVELTSEENGFVEIKEQPKSGQNIVFRASEIKNGEKVFSEGEIINPAMMASLASFGYAEVKVGRRPRVGVLATGNELVAVSEKPGKDQIRDSNSTTLKVYAEKCNAAVTVLSIVGDSIENLKSEIKNFDGDVLILSGGVSVGKYDFTKAALRELGAEIYFEKVALRPGKPTVFGKLGETLIFGLPGNPVSVAVTFNLFARAALLQMQGARDCELKTGFAVLNGKLKGSKGRASFLPARLATNEKGFLVAEPLKWGGSSDFVSFARADALCFVPADEMRAEGEVVKIAFLP